MLVVLLTRFKLFTVSSAEGGTEAVECQLLPDCFKTAPRATVSHKRPADFWEEKHAQGSLEAVDAKAPKGIRDLRNSHSVNVRKMSLPLISGIHRRNMIPQRFPDAVSEGLEDSTSSATLNTQLCLCYLSAHDSIYILLDTHLRNKHQSALWGKWMKFRTLI